MKDPNNTRPVQQADGHIVYFTGFPYWLHSDHQPAKSRYTRPFTIDMLIEGWRSGFEKRERIRRARDN